MWAITFVFFHIFYVLYAEQLKFNYIEHISNMNMARLSRSFLLEQKLESYSNEYKYHL